MKNKYKNMTTKKYKLGLRGELIYESTVNRLIEDNGFDFEAASSTAPATSKTVVTPDKTKTESSDKSFVEKANLRIFEFIVYETILRCVRDTYTFQKKDNFGKLKKYYPNSITENPFAEYHDYMYWYAPSMKKFFGPSDSFKTNVENEDGFIYDNKWLPMLKNFKKTAWYNANKDSKGVTGVFDKVYSVLDDIREKTGNSDMFITNYYTIDFSYINKKLSKADDEVTKFIEYCNVEKNLNTTLWGQMKGRIGTPDINGHYIDLKEYKDILISNKYTLKPFPASVQKIQ